MRVISTTLTRCPTHIYYLWASGRHAGLWLDCQRWRCEKCGPNKLRDLAAHIGEISRDREFLYKLEVDDPKLMETARKALSRSKYPSSNGGIPSLRLKMLDDQLIIISEATIKGRGWAAEQYDRVELLANMADIPATMIRRRDLTSDWIPEVIKPKKETVLFKKQFRGPQEVDQLLQNFGASLEQDYVVNPNSLAEELTRNLGTYEIVNDDGDKI